MITPSRRKVSEAEREREKNAVNSGHLVLGQHAQTAQTKIFFSANTNNKVRNQTDFAFY